MNIETHFIEYKDFSKEPKPNKKAVLGTLFREIAAFANASGGELVVGIEDKTGRVNEQPASIYKWLENDSLTSSINQISDNLIVFHSVREGDQVRVKVSESEDAVFANVNTTGINKGDCFIRENHASVKASGAQVRKLAERKSLSTNKKLGALGRIVHHKMSKNMNHAQHMNIFDSLLISVESPREYISVTFDALVMHQYWFGFRLPLSRYSTLQMYAEMVDKASQHNRDAFENLMESEHARESFFSAHRDEALGSRQLETYVRGYTIF